MSKLNEKMIELTNKHYHINFLSYQLNRFCFTHKNQFHKASGEVFTYNLSISLTTIYLCIQSIIIIKKTFKKT